jgi:hypothetical protein
MRPKSHRILKGWPGIITRSINKIAGIRYLLIALTEKPNIESNLIDVGLMMRRGQVQGYYRIFLGSGFVIHDIAGLGLV